MITVPVHDPGQANNIYSFISSLDISQATTGFTAPRPATHQPFRLQLPGISEEPEHTAPIDDSLELKLFNNAATLKIDFSLFAIAIDSESWRKIIFSQLDKLLSTDNWNEGSVLIEKTSFKTFLRFLTYAKPTHFPTLGVDHASNLVAAWINEPARIFVTFLANDQARASFVGKTARGDDQFTSWSGPINALRDRIELEGSLAFLSMDNV